MCRTAKRNETRFRRWNSLLKFILHLTKCFIAFQRWAQQQMQKQRNAEKSIRQARARLPATLSTPASRARCNRVLHLFFPVVEFAYTLTTTIKTQIFVEQKFSLPHCFAASSCYMLHVTCCCCYCCCCWCCCIFATYSICHSFLCTHYLLLL